MKKNYVSPLMVITAMADCDIITDSAPIRAGEGENPGAVQAPEIEGDPFWN